MPGCVRLPALDLTSVGTYSASTVDWTQVLPGGTSILVEAAINGEDFTTVSKGGAIPGLSGSMSGVMVTFKINLTSSGVATPEFSALTINVVGAGPALAQATDRYNFGQIKWLTGLNLGRAMEVKRWDASTREIVLFLAMPDSIAIGDTFDIFPGCNKAIADCHGFYDNILNFRGEPHVPGQDELNQYPDAVTG